MTSTTTPASPGVPATISGVWPPSNPSGTVIPFPLPWGQTGCCPPGGMDALMKCYCDIQQASAFIGQIMIDQINNNPAVVAAIIAAIEKSGSNLPLIGVTNGAAAQPGQVGEYVSFTQSLAMPAASNTQFVSMGVLQPGDWDVWAFAYPTPWVSQASYLLSPQPAGFSNALFAELAVPGSEESFTLVSSSAQALISVPTLMAFSVSTNTTGAGGGAGTFEFTVSARRRR